MAPVYSPAVINVRLAALSALIDAGGSNGFLVLLAGSTIVATATLARPNGAVNGGVLTFLGMPIVVSATGTGTVTSAKVTDSNGVLILSDASVGVPASTADIIIATGDNTLSISAGNTVTVLAMQLTGS